MREELKFCKGCGQYIKYCICKELEEALEEMKRLEEERLRRKYEKKNTNTNTNTNTKI